MKNAGQLPEFRFHPDPLGSGCIAASSKTCRCCRLKRGWIYQGPTYAERHLTDALCPWCIADGSAYRKLDVVFLDTMGIEEETPESIVEEISTRTPGFCTYQSEKWLSCCGEPGAFVTPAGSAEIRGQFQQLEGELMTYIVHELGISGGAARQMFESLHRDRSPTAFVFQCRKCARHMGYVDYV